MLDKRRWNGKALTAVITPVWNNWQERKKAVMI